MFEFGWRKLTAKASGETGPWADSKNAELYAEIGAFIASQGLAPTPEAYELAYRYVAQEPHLTAMTDEAIARDGRLIEAAIARILADGRSTPTPEELSRLMAQAQQKIEQVSGYITQGGDDARAYGDELSARTAVTAHVTDLLQITHAMIERTRALETRLRSSSSEIDGLRGRLDQLREAAAHDALTGLMNRGAFEEELAKLIDVTDGPIALAFCDIDHFKRFNDVYGHPVGDEVLRYVAANLARTVEGHGIAGRYGGEEFVAAFPGLTADDAEHVIHRFREAVASRALTLRQTTKKLGRVTVSAGVATLGPNRDSADLIERADKALYAAKHSGRNCVCRDSSS